MDKINLHKRRIAISINDAHDIILDLFNKLHLIDIFDNSLPTGYEIEAKQVLPTNFIIGNFPKYIINIKIISDDNANVFISFENKQTLQYKKYNLYFIMTSLCSMFLSILIAVIASNYVSRFKIFFILLPFLFIAAILLFVGSLLLEVSLEHLSKIESSIWSSLEAKGKKLLLVRDSNSDTTNTYFEYFIGIAAIVVMMAILYLLGMGNVSIILLVFIIVPSLLIITTNEIIRSLPNRFQMMAIRLPLSISWFWFIFIPLILFPFPKIIKSNFKIIINGINFFVDSGFRILIALLCFIFFSYSLREFVHKYHLRYNSILSLPSGGYESNDASQKYVKFLNTITVTLYLILSLGTISGIIFIFLNIYNYEWINIFWNSYYNEVKAIFKYFPRNILSNNIIITLISFVILVLLISPLIITILSWIFRIIGLLSRIIGKPYQDDGGEWLDSEIKSGLFSNIKKELGARYLKIVKVNNLQLKPFGAAIIKSNILGNGYILFIDLVIFTIMKNDVSQYEAIIWHEIGHYKQRNLNKFYFIDFVFNIWAEQVKCIIIDQFICELEADKFATNKMGETMSLIKALEMLKSAGWTRAPIKKETFWIGIINTIKMILGFEGLVSFYPHIDKRILNLKKLS